MFVGFPKKLFRCLNDKLKFNQLNSSNVFYKLPVEALFTEFAFFRWYYIFTFTTCRKEDCLDVNKLATNLLEDI